MDSNFPLIYSLTSDAINETYHSHRSPANNKRPRIANFSRRRAPAFDPHLIPIDSYQSHFRVASSPASVNNRPALLFAAYPRSGLIRSHPSEESLVESILRPWVTSSGRRKADGIGFIHKGDPYTAGPRIARKFKPAVAQDGERAWYFLTWLRPNIRSDRWVERTVAGGGWWHGKKRQQPVCAGQRQVGWRQSFSFKKQDGLRAGWIMLVLRLYDPERKHAAGGEIPVLCKVYRKLSDMESALAPDFSISRCVLVLHTMKVTNEEKARAYAVFKTPRNRELFLTACGEDPDATMNWLRSEMASLAPADSDISGAATRGEANGDASSAATAAASADDDDTARSDLLIHSHPSEQSLIESHLRPWVTSSRRRKAMFIHEADPYSAGLDNLARNFKAVVAQDGERAWYFLTRLRPVATAGGGDWHSEPVCAGRQQVGWRQSFSFKKQDGVRAEWTILELRLYDSKRWNVGGESEDPVLCKVYRSDGSTCSTPTPADSDISGAATQGEANGDASSAATAAASGRTEREAPGDAYLAETWAPASADYAETLAAAATRKRKHVVADKGSGSSGAARKRKPGMFNMIGEPILSDQPQRNGLFEGNARGPDFFSIPRCVSVLNTMEVTNEEKAKAYAVFKAPVNRAIFLSARSTDPEAAMIWLRNEIRKQL